MYGYLVTTIHYPRICDCKSGLSAVCLVFFDFLRVAYAFEAS